MAIRFCVFCLFFVPTSFGFRPFRLFALDLDLRWEERIPEASQKRAMFLALPYACYGGSRTACGLL